MKTLLLLVTAVGILFVSSEVRSQELTGEYFGQRKPGPEAEPFALSMLSSSQELHIRDVTFSPGGDQAYRVFPLVADRSSSCPGARLKRAAR
jgi:hypothetical protein